MWESATASEPRESTISSRSCASSSTHAGMQPSVLLISADDLPRNILGVYGAQHGLTPNIDALRGCGVHLDSFYSFKTCAPARASILSGRYPFSMGIYENADVDSAGAPTNFTFLPELLRRAGWRTHAVGKWHVGFRSNGMTPTSRGFESFLGTYSTSGHFLVVRELAHQGVRAVAASTAAARPSSIWVCRASICSCCTSAITPNSPSFHKSSK